MSWDFFLSWQFGMTLVAALAIGIWQFLSIRRSRAKRGEEKPVEHPLGSGERNPPRR
ncbi:MAG: hypothetical protein AAGC69_14225 [Paracraurococcus sp.]